MRRMLRLESREYTARRTFRDAWRAVLARRAERARPAERKARFLREAASEDRPAGVISPGRTPRA